jgi:hypothetical protein
MNQLIVNFDNGTDLNAVYTYIKKSYPNAERVKTPEEMQEIIEDEYLLALAEERMSKNNISHSREEIMREFGITESDLKGIEVEI